MNQSPDVYPLLMFLDLLTLTIWACYSIYHKM